MSSSVAEFREYPEYSRAIKEKKRKQRERERELRARNELIIRPVRNCARRVIHRDRGVPRGGKCRRDFIEVGRRSSEYLGLPLWLEFSRGIAIG
jgi:hypothetical protein